MRFYPRLLELLLLSVSFAMSGVAFLAVHRANYATHALQRDALAIELPLGAFLLTHWVLSFTRPRANQVLIPIVAALTGIGLVFLYRLPADFPQHTISEEPAAAAAQQNWDQPQVQARRVPHDLPGQAAAVIMGMVGLLVLANIRSLRALSRYKYLCMVLGLGFLLATAIFGRVVHNKALAISIAGFAFQPTELVKLLLVIFMAAYLAERSRIISQRWGRWVLSGEDIRYLGPLFIIWVASQLLLFYQKDLGAALLFFGIFLAMIFIANARAIYLLLGWLMFAGGAVYAYEFSQRTRDRIEIWLHPWQHGGDQSYQIVQGLFALGFGGLLGTGWGHGAPHFIPAVQTDFIFSGLAEELGLAGALGILVLYLLLCWQGFGIALRAKNTFSTLLAAGLTLVLAIQVGVIIGGVLTLIPLTGVPVPFMSRGGTNMVCNLALVGMLLAVSAEDPEPPRESRVH